MQVAKLFATLGFQVDDSQLVVFETRLREVRNSTAMFARNLRVVNTNLRSVRTSMSNLNSTMAANMNVSKANARISGSFNNIRSNVQRVVRAFDSLETASNKVIPILNRVRAILHRGSNAWETYATNAIVARAALQAFSAQLASTRAAAGNINVRVNQNNGAPPRPHGGGAGGLGGTGAAAAGGAAGALLRPMLGGWAAGGLLGAGFAVKELITAGREMQKMDNIILVSSRNTAEYSRSMAFVSKTAKYLGVNVTELGSAYGKTLQASQKVLNLDQTEKMFTGIGELMTTMQLNAEDQKGVFRAVTQMFTKTKIQAEEVLQIAERGLPALQLIKEAAMEYYKVDSKGYDKLVTKGLIETAKIMPIVADKMAKLSRNNDALAKALKASNAGQERFKNNLRVLSYALTKAGLDKALNDLFTGLANIVEILTPFATNLVKATSGVISIVKILGTFISEHKKLIATLAAGVFFIMKWRAAAILGGSAFSIMARIVTGGLYAMGNASKKFPLLLMLYALYEFGVAYADHMNGKTSWVSVLISWTESAIAAFDNLAARFELAISIMENRWVKFQDMLGLQPSVGSGGGQSPLQNFGDRVMSSIPSLNPATQMTNFFTDWLLDKAFKDKPANQPTQTNHITFDPLKIDMTNPDGSKAKYSLDMRSATGKPQ